MTTTKAMLMMVLSGLSVRDVLAAVLPSNDVSTIHEPAELSGNDNEHANTVLGKRAAPGNETDTEMYKTMSWCWAGKNTTVTSMPSNPTVNLTGEAQPDERFLNIDYFKDAAKSIHCSSDAINVTFKDQPHFVRAQLDWEWHHDASITASNWTWEEALPEWRLRIKSEGIMANTSSGADTLEKPVDQKASIPITQTFNAGFSLMSGLTGTASLTPSGVGAAVTLGLTVAAALTQESSSSLTIADIPLGGGIDIVGIKVGPQLVVAATVGITSVTAATTISFGVQVSVPDDSLAKVDFSDSANNQFNGWNPSFTGIGPNLDASVSVSGSAGSSIRLEVDATILGKGLSAGLNLMVPEFTIDASAQATPDGGVCGDDNAFLGIEFDVNLAAELDAFGGIAAASDLPNPFTLLSTQTPIFSTCITLAGTATSTATAEGTLTADGVGAFGGVVGTIAATAAATPKL
ncbi:hypothetical protein LTR78_004058 [Recurvomyces mirabilis]|uniref:Uncharacterized protein n=1 Tax=Recurvomyces mirabilis TaxID=574656 RepID=A0AAE1C2N6_9PEZI|nr:hypothetical protein LTR78_004058 [Recurvomyces mirabilis]KAK5153768.1 hypothetical protein LTS14_007462 [Recurvomyces mirabilis]